MYSRFSTMLCQRPWTILYSRAVNTLCTVLYCKGGGCQGPVFVGYPLLPDSF